jgi:hypothetical protein
MATTSSTGTGTGTGPFNTRPRFPTSNSGSIPRSTSSLSSPTLPSIRSLRKAFQFTSNSNSNSKRASVDSYLNGGGGGGLRSASASTAAEVAAEQLRKSNGVGRTFSGGSLPRPVIESTTDGIAKSASVGNIPALTGSGAFPTSAPTRRRMQLQSSRIHLLPIVTSLRLLDLDLSPLTLCLWQSNHILVLVAQCTALIYQ